MKLLQHIHDEAELVRVVSLLETRGIPCYVRSERQFQALYRVAVFVYFDRQYADACALLRDKNHSVKEPVDVLEFNRATARQDHKQLLKYTLVVLIASIVLLAVSILVTR